MCDINTCEEYVGSIYIPRFFFLEEKYDLSSECGIRHTGHKGRYTKIAYSFPIIEARITLLL